MVASLDKKLLALVRAEARLQRPEILKSQIAIAVERVRLFGDRSSLVTLIRAIDPVRHDKFCEHLLARLMEAGRVAKAACDQKAAKYLADPLRVLTSARRAAEEADEVEYVRIRGLLDPEWQLAREEAEHRVALREEQAKVRRDRAAFSTTFSKAGGRMVVQGGAPSLGQRR